MGRGVRVERRPVVGRLSLARRGNGRRTVARRLTISMLLVERMGEGPLILLA